VPKPFGYIKLSSWSRYSWCWWGGVSGMNRSREVENGYLSCLPVFVSWCWKLGRSLHQSVGVVGTDLGSANGIYKEARG
jgi:hypothetical protein